MNDLFPSHYDAGQLRLRADRMGLSFAFAEREPWGVRVWRFVKGLWQ